MKRAFTLLEVMLALTILSLVGIAASYQLYGMIGIYRFEKETTGLALSLKEAQLVAITYQTDLTLTLSKKGEKWAYQLDSDEPISWIDRKSHPLKEVTKITLDTKPYLKKEALTFRISSSGRIEPCALIGFFDKNQEEKTPPVSLDLTVPIQVELRKRSAA